MANPSRSLELFFIDGNPEGMLTAEVFNWTGHVLVTPRTRLQEALRRKESSYTGAYILLGETEAGLSVYVGEGEDIGERIKNHDARMTWWTSAIFIVATGDALNKAHAKYLEARLLQIASAVGAAALHNTVTPTLTSLSEAQAANMEAFLEHLLLVLPAVRVDAFLKRTRADASAPVGAHRHAHSSTEAEFELSTPKHGVRGRARLVDGEFVVLEGSLARERWEGSPSHSYADLYEELVRGGVLVADQGYRKFSTNYAFKSPSAAGAIMNGRATNGQEAWKLAGTARTYRDWEQDVLNS